MYLKQVTINGFKSFADKTVIELPKGIVGIVGPNGCGKSNIVDAIRWVLGEQSAKALRGGKMQDVIFQGTDKRKPLQMCEVKLLFGECEQDLKTNFSEVEITRRVSRDGGSDYFINGKISRLKEIQSLFMDTGIGRVSYSFMVQGQIDQILSSNPSERRAIFEEAAGITKYKTQRREALNKLSLVDQNLARITDRIEEINRQIGTLKRQAGKALKYKRLSHKLKHLDLALNAKIYSDQTQTINEYQNQSQQFAEELQKLGGELAQKEEALLAMRSSRADILIKLEEARNAAAELRSQKEQTQRNCEFAQVRKRDLLERIALAENEINALNEQLKSLSGKAEGDNATKAEQLELFRTFDESFKAQNAQLQEIELSLKDAESALYRAKQDSLVNEGAITRLRSNCTSLEVDLKSYQIKHSAAADSAFQLKEQLNSFDARKLEYDASAESAKSRTAAVQSEIAQLQEQNTALISQYRDKQSQIQIMDRQLASKSAKLSLLNDFQNRLEGYSDGVKAVMQGKVADIVAPDSVKIIAQSLEIKDGWATAFEAMLGSSIDTLSIADESKLGELIAALKERNLGKACIKLNGFLVFANPETLPDGIYKAADFASYTGQDETLKQKALNLLQGCYFCESIEAFVKFAIATPNFTFALACDKSGNVVDCRGVVYSASSELKDTESSFILRNREIKRLTGEVEIDNNALTKLHEEAMALQSQMNSIEAQIDEKKAVESEIKRELVSIEAQLASLEQNRQSRESELEKQNALLAEMENSRFEAQDKLNRANAQLAEAEEKEKQSKALIAEKENALAEIREQKEMKFAQLSEARIDLATKKQALENLEKGLDIIKSRQSETLGQIQKRTSEMEQARQAVEQLDLDSEKDANLAKELEAKLAADLQSIEEQKNVLAEKEKSLAEFESSMQGLRNANKDAADKKNSADIELAKLKSRRDFTIERIRSDYELDIAAIDYKQELWNAQEEFQTRINLDDIEDEDGEIAPKTKDRGEATPEALEELANSSDFGEIENQVKDLRQKIAAMGAVNLVAIEEYAELKERYDFLKKQSDDLWTAKNELVSAIDEINATSQKMFAETFEQIRKNFEFTFKKLFGGGSADLNLVQSEDVLDSGIEIIARPPGTVLKSLSLLSGGQRTMTAVSLLFAIYMVKPSPFCVLDELDAPLDDANIGRYTDILKEFTAYSQFLVITHSKRTVSAANTIYGVTMQERGVTKLVSMRFTDYQ